jgi:hypothetical protein
MRIAVEDLALDQLVVVYPGEQRYRLAERVTVLPLKTIALEGAQARMEQPASRAA